MWNISTGICVQTLEGHRYSISSLVYLNDNETIVSGSWDRMIQVWNYNTGEIVQTICNDHVINCLLVLNEKTLVCSQGEIEHRITLFHII